MVPLRPRQGLEGLRQACHVCGPAAERAHQRHALCRPCGHALVAEEEIPLRLGGTPASGSYSADCVATFCVSLDIVGTRLAGSLSAPSGWKLADQCVHLVLVIGPERA